MNREQKIVELENQVAAATVTDLSAFNTPFEAHCKHDSNFFVEVASNHLSLVDAQKFYQDQVRREEGRFINIVLSQEGDNFIDLAVTLSVEDSEKLALHILSLCQAIKGS